MSGADGSPPHYYSACELSGFDGSHPFGAQGHDWGGAYYCAQIKQPAAAAGGGGGERKLVTGQAMRIASLDVSENAFSRFGVTKGLQKDHTPVGRAWSFCSPRDGNMVWFS
jgi:hypothetical protein